MNSKNKILVGCLALLLVLSVGYALFSDTITINGTASAKGDFNITPTCTLGVLEEFKSLFEDEGGTANDTCTVDDATDTVTFSSEILYPGAKRYFTVKITNTGTINATLPTSLTMPDEGIKFCYTEDLNADAETEGECLIGGGDSSETGLYAAQVGDGTIYDATDPTALPKEIQQAFWNGSEYVLKPGNSVYYFVLNGLSENYGPESGVLNIFASRKYIAEFEQATN